MYDDLVFVAKNTEGHDIEIRIKVEDYVFEIMGEDGMIDHCAVLIAPVDDKTFYDPRFGYGILLGDAFI